MPTAVESKYVFAKLDELEPAARLAPGATDDGRKRFDVRRTLDITAFGVSAFSAPSGVTVINEHDETLLGEAGQEELYIVVNGAATFEIDGETVEAPTGALVNVQPTAKRKATATEDGTTILVVGGTPARRTSRLRRKPRRHSPPTARATTRTRWRSSSSSSRSSRTIPLRTSTSGASRREPGTPTRRSRPSGGRSRSTTASRS